MNTHAEPTPVVVDASLAVKWVLDEEHSADARALLGTWIEQGRYALVPSWFACEVANVLHQRVRRGHLTLPHACEAFAEVMATVTVADDDPTVALRTLQLGSQFSQEHTYDCQYVALAERADCDCWTADVRFWRAAGGTILRVRWVGQALASNGTPDTR